MPFIAFISPKVFAGNWKSSPPMALTQNAGASVPDDKLLRVSNNLVPCLNVEQMNIMACSEI